MPQGYTESPTYFSQILKADLANVDFPNDATLIQHIDDLLLGLKMKLDSQKGTIYFNN